MAKKYALVRVDNYCPDLFEKINNKFVCKVKQAKDGCRLDCSDCRYGDTKEQLIRKVVQVIKRITNDGYVVAYKKFGTGYINTALNIKDVAKEIVEFLGVGE